MQTIRLDVYVFDTLMRDLVGHDQQPSSFLLYLCMWSRASGGKVSLSLSQLAEESGLSKRSVQYALRHLTHRRLLRAERAHATAVPVYELLRPWRRKR